MQMQGFLLGLLIFILALLCVAGDNDSYQKRVGKKYLDEVAAKSGSILLKSGMVIEILHESDK